MYSCWLPSIGQEDTKMSAKDRQQSSEQILVVGVHIPKSFTHT